ncbi:MAG TPA: beta-propeller fold lactonase family protein, partial [Myxococcales bacterium]
MRHTFVLGTAALFLLAAACGSGRTTAAFAYVANNDLSSISVFQVDAKTGMLSLSRTVDAAPGGATYCEIHPSGRLMFVSGQFGSTVSAYAIDAAGIPALVAGSTLPTGANPHNLALDPEGRFLYVANTGSDSVSAFAVAASGALTPVAGSPFAAGHTPYDVKLAASGKFAYAVNRDTDDVSVYAVNASTGALAPIPHQPFGVACRAPPCGPRAIEFSPDGRFAFVPNRFSSDVSVLRV